MGLRDKFKKGPKFDKNPNGLKFVFKLQVEGKQLPKNLQTKDQFNTVVGEGVFLSQLFDQVFVNFDDDVFPEATIMTVRFLKSRESVILGLRTSVPDGFDNELPVGSDGRISTINFFRHKKFTGMFNDLELLSEYGEYQYGNLAKAYQKMMEDILKENDIQCTTLKATTSHELL